MIFGVNATKSAVVIAETGGVGGKFVVLAIRTVPFRVGSGEDLAELLKNLGDVFERKGNGGECVIALLKCSSGRFNSGGKLRNWSRGAAGAVAVAFKVAGGVR
jgi:hypothetical protein